MAFITQLLAIFGIANEINVMVWALGLSGIGGLVSLVTSLMAWWAYDEAYVASEDSDSTSAELTAATVVMAGLKDDMLWSTLDGLTTELGLASVAEEWYMWNMYKAGGEEMKEERMEGEGDRPPRGEGGQGPPTRELIAQVIDIINF